MHLRLRQINPLIGSFECDRDAREGKAIRVWFSLRRTINTCTPLSCIAGSLAYLREGRSCPARPREAADLRLRGIFSRFGFVDGTGRSRLDAGCHLHIRCENSSVASYTVICLADGAPLTCGLVTIAMAKVPSLLQISSMEKER